MRNSTHTFKGVIRSRELALATEDEITSALWKQGVTNIKRISIRKGEQRIQTNTYILTFDKPRTPNEVKIGYCLERVEQYVPAPWNASNAENMDTTGKPAQDDRHVRNAVKITLTMWRKIAWKKSHYWVRGAPTPPTLCPPDWPFLEVSTRLLCNFQQSEQRWSPSWVLKEI